LAALRVVGMAQAGPDMRRFARLPLIKSKTNLFEILFATMPLLAHGHALWPGWHLVG